MWWGNAPPLLLLLRSFQHCTYERRSMMKFLSLIRQTSEPNKITHNMGFKRVKGSRAWRVPNEVTRMQSLVSYKSINEYLIYVLMPVNTYM